ncbi:MAG TPA: hypothetical protein VKE22_10055 [Haliangiales bacterium]|nr:hypothetical protein [Haliangiales bacterium]
MGRLVLGLVIIDALAVAAFGLVPPRETLVITDETPAPKPAVAPAELARRMAALVQTSRRAAKGKKVVVAPPRRVGDDIELVVSLARDVGFPAGLYCARCAAQRCLFPEATAQALDALAAAFPAADVAELARLAPVELAATGGASGGPVVKKDVAQACQGGAAQTSIRFPAAFDAYDEKDCSARDCAAAGTTVHLASGPIDDNRALACLRAACLVVDAPAGAPAKLTGEVATEQGAAYRGAEVVLTVRGVAPAAWDAVSAAAGEEP